MSGNTVKISLNGIEFNLIGTAHVSRESIEEVDKIIREEKPDIVCVELDQSRYNSITQNDNWEKLNLFKVFKEGKGFLLIVNLVLASFQRRLGSELGVKPGEEMKTAIETAKELGIPHSLCDREIHTTLRRAWAKCGFWNKSKLLASLLASAFTKEKLDEQEIESLKNSNEMDGMMNELSEYLPPVKTVLIDERDRYLASKIWESSANAQQEQRAKKDGGDASPVKKVAAVVGAGHMQGMISHLEKLSRGEEATDVSDIDVIPPKTFFSKAAGFIIPAVIVAVIAIGFIFKGPDRGIEMLLQWAVWNGALAALGSLLALAHPLAILVSFIGAPFATLNPLIGVGFFSGIVQVTFSKPRVCDLQNMTNDTTGIKGIYRNRITRALLVFFLSSLGGAIGNFTVPIIWGLLGS